MTRTRSVLLLFVLAASLFIFQQFVQWLGGTPNLSTLVPLLTVLLALLTLLMAPRSVVLYGACTTIVLLISAILDAVNSQANSFSRIILILGSVIFAAALSLLLRRISQATWVRSQRYAQAPNDPWVAIDKGFDPTIGSDKEDT